MIDVLSWLVDTTLKGSVMILLVAAIQRVIGSRVHARWRHLLWVIVLLRLVVPDAPSSKWSLFNLLPSDERGVVAAAHDIIAPPAALSIDPPVRERVIAVRPSTAVRVMRGIGWIWLAGAILLALRIVIGSIRTQLAVSRALRTSPPARGGAIRIVECDVVKTPALHGLFRPVLLLPRGFAGAFSAEELRHVVLHETWHLRRLDVAVSWLLSAAQTIHWFNPLVWFAASRIREERELSCDELALSLLEEEERLGYGRTILKLLERFRVAAPVPAMVGIVNRKQKMKRRLTMIASFQNRTRFTMLFLMLVVAVGAVGLTDKEGGVRRFSHKLDPAAVATVERLHERLSFKLTNGSLNDLLTAVSNKTGVPIAQSPELATLAVQNARFTIEADNVPAHAVLMESLMPFELSAEPTAAGVTIEKGKPHTLILRHSTEGADVEEDVIVTNGSPEEGRKVMRVLKGEKPAGEANERLFVRRIAKDPASLEKAGTLRRELTLKLNENGVTSEGKLTIEIVK